MSSDSSYRKIRHDEPSFKTKVFGAGIAACLGDMVTFPLDTAKVRLQLQGEGKKPKHFINVEKRMKYRGMVGTISTIAKEEGTRGLYKGIVPGLQRQMCFASVRVGCYDDVKKSYMKLFKKDKQDMNIGIRLLSGITTGVMCVCLAQPTDVVKIRMQAQTGNGLYTSSLQAYKTIFKTDGIRGLWRGCLPNMTRNGVVNVGELVSYDIFKDKLIRSGLLVDGILCHFVSAFGAGFCATIVASPVDVVKTRFMNSQKGQYKGAIDCAISMYKEGGHMAFYKGFVPSFMRLGSWNIVMFLCYEQIKKVMTPVPITVPQ